MSSTAVRPDATCERRPLRTPDVIAALAVSVLYLAHALYFRVFLDDAFISFRYARNFADGLGLVYNAGERVEGYTDFLWVFLLGVLGKLGIDIPSAAATLGIGVSLGTIALLRFHPSGSGSKVPWPWGWMPSLFLACSLAFVFQAGSGLATALFTFLLTLSVFVRERWPRQRVPREALPLALLALTRPEGCLIFLVFLLVEIRDVLFAPAADARYPGERWKRPLYLALVFGALFVPYFVWRWSYYGFLLPNTFYAKVGSTAEQAQRGFVYLRDFLPHVVIVSLLIIVLCALHRRARQGQGLRVSLIVVYSAYVVSVGGDHMPVFRFFVPILPLLYLVLRDASLEVLTHKRKSLQLAGLAILAASVAHTASFSFRDRLGNVFQETLADKRAQERELRLVGEHFASIAPPGSSIALGITGAIGYYSRLPILDFFGLTDVQIAHRAVGGMGIGAAGHEKGDGYYILSRKPTYVMNTYARLHERPPDLNNAAVRAQLFWSLSERQIASSQDFWNEYRIRTVPLAGRFLVYYERAAGQ